MAWYKTGTVSITSGQTSVTGTDTKFATNARVGDGFNGPDGKWYEITNIASETVLGIYPAYAGATVTNSASYVIAPLQGYNKDSADRLRAITDSFDLLPTQIDTLFQGKYLKLAFMGDSLTQESVRNNSWAKQVGEIIESLGNVKVETLNAAINGSTFQSALNVKQHNNGTKSQVERVVDFKPDIVFIALGVNDCIFFQNYSATDIKAYALSMVNAIRTGSPSTKIVYVEQACHDLSKGIIPTTLTNTDTVASSHEVLSLNGITNVRINNSSYLSLNIPTAKLNGHKTWGDATQYIRGICDGYITANIWKLNRLGCLVDALHVSELGHTYWAWQVINYLATNALAVSKINWLNLKILSIDTNITTSLDEAYNQALNLSVNGTSSSQYRGYNLYERMSGWMLTGRGTVFTIDTAMASAVHNLAYSFKNATPGAQLWVSVDGFSFINTNRVIDANGTISQILYPSNTSFLSALKFAGNHKIYLALVNTDGSCDAFERTITVNGDYYPVGATTLRYLSTAFPLSLNGANYLSFDSSDHDELNVGVVTPGSPSSGIYIPQHLNGRKVRFRANIRVNMPLDGTETDGGMLNLQIQKNRQYPPGNSNASGRGLPTSNRLLRGATVLTAAHDFNLVSAAVSVVTGDYFEVVVQPYKSSSGASSVLAHSCTWFEIELVN